VSLPHNLGLVRRDHDDEVQLVRVLKGSPRSLRVMAPPPLLYAYHTRCRSTSPSVSFDITLNVGSRHLPVVHVRLASKLKFFSSKIDFLFGVNCKTVRTFVVLHGFTTSNCKIKRPKSFTVNYM
jgi:hypothetical protein